MRLTPRTTDLIDLTKSKNAVITLPKESRNFDGSKGKGNGPVNASGMGSSVSSASPGVPVVSGIYGSGSYGSGVYGEALEQFGKFIDAFKQHDPALIECIQKGFNTIFMEK